jgi:hypothetical protein
VRINERTALAQQLLQSHAMNAFFLLIVVAVIGVVFWFQKHSDSGRAAETRAAVELAEQTGASPQPSSAANGQAPPHSYMKRAIDRARDVRDQARAGTQQAQEP